MEKDDNKTELTEEKIKTPVSGIFYLVFFLSIIVAGFILKTMASVIMPIVFAVMLSFVLFPIVKKLSRRLKFPWLLSTILVFALFVIALLALSSLLISSLLTITEQYPKYETKFMSIYTIFAENFNLEVDKSKSFIENMWSFLKVREYVQKIAVTLSTGAVSFGKNLFSIILLAIFLVLEMRITKRKMHVAFGKDKEKINRIAHQIANQTVNYISIKFFISLATGLLAFFATKVIKMDFPLVWGFVAFIMNFIPYFGSLISIVITTLFAILQFAPDSIAKPIFILIAMIMINLVLGNIVEPRVEGKNLDLSPFIILVSLSIWGYLWGFIGMIFAVPMTVIIKIVCENIDYLSGIAIFLGNKPTPPEKPEAN